MLLTTTLSSLYCRGGCRRGAARVGGEGSGMGSLRHRAAAMVAAIHTTERWE